MPTSNKPQFSNNIKNNRQVSMLGDICQIAMGQSPSSDTYTMNKAGVPFFQGNADFGEENPIPRIWCNKPIKIANENDILISVRAPIGSINIANRKCCIGRGLAKITLNPSIYLRYMIWYLRYKTTYLQSIGTGSTFKAINKKQLEALPVVLPNFNEQVQIGRLLDLLSSLIHFQNKRLKILDKLVKSQFEEYFGCECYPKVNLNDLCVKITDGVHAKPRYTITGRPFISVQNITKGVIDFSKCKYISEDDYLKMSKRIKPARGDVLYTKVGATYGIPAYVDTDENFGLYVSVCLIKPNHNKIDSKFLAISMAMPYIKEQADKRIKGIGVPDLHLCEIRNFEIIYPPKDVQHQFVVFIDQINKSKFVIQQSIEKLELLKKSFMQQYFG